jgi:hypothetical protein
MTVPVEADDAPEQRPDTGAELPHEPAALPKPPPTAPEAVAAICPYLTASRGSWRMASPSRDHRCAAVDPPASQTTDKQRRHCLSDDHVDCSVFRAARSARAATLAAGADPLLVDAADGRRRPLARTAPVLLERPRLVDQAVRLQFERGPGQIALIALMVVAFAIVALTRISGGTDPAAAQLPSQLIAATTPSPTPTRVATPSLSPSIGPSGSPAPSSRTYKVKKGDTLTTIAKAFGTTAAKIKTINALKTSTLRIGQVLKIP